MSRKVLTIAIAALGLWAAAGCGDSKPSGGNSGDPSKQPKLSGDPDPRIKGPVAPAGGEQQAKPVELKP